MQRQKRNPRNHLPQMRFLRSSPEEQGKKGISVSSYNYGARYLRTQSIYFPRSDEIHSRLSCTPLGGFRLYLYRNFCMCYLQHGN
jgi:hypothetical protein